MPPSPRILIAGCGAIGSVFACLLRQAEYDVTLLGRPSHLNAIASQGLHLDGIWGSHTATGFHLAATAAGLSAPYELILIAVKAYDTQSMVEAVAPFIDSEGLAISLQNGLGNLEILARAFGPEKSLGANVLVGATIPGPGRVTVTVQAAPIILGPLEVSDCVMLERIHAWARAFKAASIPCETTTRVLSYLWAKVFYNAPLNALGALLDVHYGVLADEPELTRIMNRVIDEAFQVAAKKNIDCLWKNANEYREYFYGHLVPSTYDHRSSMLQDLQRGRRTEIDAINGQIWRYGTELQVPTPFNEIMTRLIWQKEKPAQ
ncbi:MAG TPA: ketopantoate reductase family protein [Candidatus Binatia bacterium]